MFDRAQASHQSTHTKRTHEDSLSSWLDSPEANRKVDFLQARRAQNQKNQENDSVEGVGVWQSTSGMLRQRGSRDALAAVRQRSGTDPMLTESDAPRHRGLASPCQDKDSHSNPGQRRRLVQGQPKRVRFITGPGGHDTFPNATYKRKTRNYHRGITPRLRGIRREGR
jgi:hypothetical protein